MISSEQSEKQAKKVIASMLKRSWAHQGELRILVTGKAGEGKSTLVNGMLGAKVAKERVHAIGCTALVATFSKTINNVSVKVFESPGLQDGTTTNEEEYIQNMKDICQKLSLVLYCTKMTNPRLRDGDRNAMRKLTKAFGEEFWNNAVFVLTFANREDVTRSDDRDDQDEEEPDVSVEEGWKELEKQRFQGRIRSWAKELQEFLIKEANVSSEIATKIPVVPTGDYKQTRHNTHPLVLPDRENWFNDFWKVSCLRMKDTRLFLHINCDRLCVSMDDNSDSESEETATYQVRFYQVILLSYYIIL